jgi:prepilin-type N-terminal cleavage/methylation domain-containing protein
MRKEQGFSLIEVMIAATITVIMLAAAMSAFNSSVGLNEKISGMGDLEQNIRVGMNLVVSDFMSAGWMIPKGGIPIPSGGAGTLSVLRPDPPGGSVRSFTTKIDAINPGAGLGPTINTVNTDFVNILYADNEVRLDQNAITAISTDGSSITIANTIQISGEGILNPIKPGDLIALSNTNGNAIQYVTNVLGQTITFASGTSDVSKLNQPNATSGSVLKLRNADNSWPVSTTMAKRVWLISYFLDTSRDASKPCLMRQVNYETPRAVALVMEGLQLTYDIVDLDTNPTNVENPSTPSQIRKANILLTGRSTWHERNSSEYLRRSLTTQVSIRSLSYFDRYH